MSEQKDPQQKLDERKETKIAAKRKVMDIIARREHSEAELRTKLHSKFADVEGGLEAIEEAISYAKDKNWLEEPSALAYRLADMLHLRNKGINYINGYLEEKGLPSIETDSALELKKALAIVANKFDEDFKFSHEDKARVGRLLASRGFDSETVRKVIYEKL
ncbi:regulatory protein RecX [Bdellovibrio sp. HCB288]|uniref:regulatory protein RecX n=1 Tax=Bdellovibrio sp. HCB288 TaxID=3394355 RepID=UPI0039B5077C